MLLLLANAYRVTEIDFRSVTVVIMPVRVTITTAHMKNVYTITFRRPLPRWGRKERGPLADVWRQKKGEEKSWESEGRVATSDQTWNRVREAENAQAYAAVSANLMLVDESEPGIHLTRLPVGKATRERRAPKMTFTEALDNRILQPVERTGMTT